MVIFSAIAQDIWLCIDNSEALSGIAYQIMIFSGHFDIVQPDSVKKFEIWHNLSHGCGGSLFELGQLSMTPLWLNQSINPPLHWLIFCQILNFLIGLDFSTSKWPEKKKNFIGKLLPGFSGEPTDRDILTLVSKIYS